MAQNAQNADQLATLAEHERIVRATQIPAFNGDRTKPFNAKNYISFFENAASIAKWDTDEKKLMQFRAVLQGEALAWWKSLELFSEIDTKNWEVVKERFLLNYDKKGTAKTICTNFKDLHQKPRECVNDFFARLASVFEKMREIFPDVYKTVREPAGDNETAYGRACKDEGRADTMKFFMEQLLLAGMHEKLRVKVQESGVTGLLLVLDKAAELERLEEDNKPSSQIPKIAAVSDSNDGATDPIGPLQDLQEDEIEAVNAIRANKGRAPFLQGHSGSGQKKQIQCRYCKKWGHFQKDCRSRLRNNAPMVGEDGKPYQPRQPFAGQKKTNNFAVKAIQEDEEDEPAVVGYVNSVRTISPNSQDSLNW